MNRLTLIDWLGKLEPIANNSSEDARENAYAVVAQLKSLLKEPSQYQVPVICPYCNFNGQNNCANVAEEIRQNGGTPGDGRCSNYQVYGKRAHFDKSVAMRGLIREIFLKNGFTIREGQTDLKEYVYEAAFALLAATQTPPANPEPFPLAVDSQEHDLDSLISRAKVNK